MHGIHLLTVFVSDITKKPHQTLCSLIVAMNNPGFGGTINPMGTLSGGMRPGTNMMMRPGSQMRPGSTRMQAVGIGGSLQQPVAVTAAAPIAREGMRASSRSGLGTSAGPGRQVGDRSYYIGLLRPKNT